MAAQLPIVTTNVGGITEMIKENYNGILIEPKSPKNLSSAIIKIINDPQLKKYLAKNAKKTLIQDFSLNNMVIKTQAQY